jgi:hypothetical protein
MKRNYTLCEGTGCPIRQRCGRWQEHLDKKTTEHWGQIPYQHQRIIPFEKTGERCFYFEDDAEEVIKASNDNKWSSQH